MTTRKISLKVVHAPATGIVLDAPPRTQRERSFGGLYLRPVRHDIAACRGEPGSRGPAPLCKLRLVQFNGRIASSVGGLGAARGTCEIEISGQRSAGGRARRAFATRSELGEFQPKIG
jgi:hypothetical protein